MERQASSHIIAGCAARDCCTRSWRTLPGVKASHRCSIFLRQWTNGDGPSRVKMGEHTMRNLMRRLAQWWTDQFSYLDPFGIEPWPTSPTTLVERWREHQQ